MSEASTDTCPHCGTRLLRFELPDAFDHAYDLACFNDECSYYVRGWSWMAERFGVRSSYRYRVDGLSGQASPIAVWSPNALRSSIVTDDSPASPALKEHS